MNFDVNKIITSGTYQSNHHGFGVNQELAPARFAISPLQAYTKMMMGVLRRISIHCYYSILLEKKSTFSQMVCVEVQ